MRTLRAIAVAAASSLLALSCSSEKPAPSGENVSAVSSAVRAPVYPLKLGPAGTRYLVDQNGVPFFWSGDAAWSLIAQLSLADANQYLDDRQAKGFDVVLVNLIEHKFATHAPADIAHDAPFTGRPFATPNEAYFSHADDVIRAAASHGMTVLLAPLYLGFQCGDEGWCSEVQAATSAELHSWGQYVGTRYAAFDNIVWLIGGDTDPTPVKSQVLEVVNGIREKDTRHLMTAHNDKATARSAWPGQNWLTIDNVYSYNPSIYQDYAAVYATTPIMPFFEVESNYEHENGVNTPTLRAQAYWAILSGAMGHVFGNCPIWHMGSTPSWCNTADWVGNLNSAGSTSISFLNRLFATRPWHTFVPDTNNSVMTSGALTGTSHATTARTVDGSTIVAYIPTSRQVKIDMTKVSGTQAKAWWYAPATGTATLIGTFATTGTRAFTSPSGDSVLVIDNAALNIPAPGAVPTSAPPTIATAASASPSPATGTTTTAHVVGADDSGATALRTLWTANAPGVTFSPNGTNAAQDTVATFSAAGTYTLTATVIDAEGQVAISNVDVTVAPTHTTTAVTPNPVTVSPSGTQQFTATARDQFGGSLSPQPSFAWTASGGGSISTTGSFTAGATPGGPFTVTATAAGISGSAQVTVGTAPPPPDTVVDFETLTDNAALTSFGGITWGTGSGGWRVWDGGSTYTKNAFINSTSPTEVVATFSLPAGRVLKSLEIAVGSGGTATSVKLSSPGNTDRVYTDINGTYKTKTLGWTTAAQVVTITVTCPTTDGASDLAFDDITYGAP